MYKPTAKNIRLYDGENECPTPTEDLGIFAGNRVYPVAGSTIGDVYSEWRNYMVLLDPVVIEDDNGPLTQYRSSFAYTEYDYADDGDADGSSANQRVPEFPITGTFYNRHAYSVPRVCVLYGTIYCRVVHVCFTKNTPLHGQISPKTYLVYLICFVFVFCLGGTGRFDSASGAVKNLGYTVITNEATGYYEQYEGL